jgi:myo-inositol-1(or 4)-monophosphatase
LVEDEIPVAGVVHAPALGQTFVATRGAGASLNGAPARVSGRATLAGARIAGPRPDIEALAAIEGVEVVPKIPSLAIRVCGVATGSIDIGFASTGAHDWDLAAAGLMLAEAGGALVTLDGRPVVYNKAHPTHGPLIAARRELVPELVALAGRGEPGRARRALAPGAVGTEGR